MDLTEVEFEGQFARCIREYFEYVKPRKILETGLYHGMGSTRIIATLIRDIPIENAEFFSIECSAFNIEVAKENLRLANLLPHVSIVSGLSIPEYLLPTREEIDNKIQRAASHGGVKLDHEQDPANGSNYYQKETSSYDRDDRLRDVLSLFKGKPDFALLDSGGHIGKIEFDYLISNIEGPCTIALDDTRHIKHFESAEMIKKDPRFTVLADNSEKFGSMLVKFTP
jgi:hypothetical protein